MRYLFIILGFICTALGCIGVILPILPTTPFLLLASFCFAKGSERFHTWFKNTKLYQKHLADFVEKRGMTRKTKWSILLFASTLLAIGFYFSDVLIARVIIAIVFCAKYLYFYFCIETIKEED